VGTVIPMKRSRKGLSRIRCIVGIGWRDGIGRGFSVIFWLLGHREPPSYAVCRTYGLTEVKRVSEKRRLQARHLAPAVPNIALAQSPMTRAVLE
jgi:hypothetical protein